MATHWLIWQLIDSAFPTGGFAHSGGLEAMWQSGQVTEESLPRFLELALRQTASGMLPFLNAAHRGPDDFATVDAACDAFITGHIANRASRAQGQALLASAERAFPRQAVADLLAKVRREKLPAHLPVVFGGVTRILEVEPEEAVRVFMFVTLRGLISSAVRLGIVGPLRGQELQSSFGLTLETLCKDAHLLPLESAAQSNPLMELVQNMHDRLYSRLFQS